MTNADDVYTKFLKLNSKEMRKALTTGLRKALAKIQKDAKTNLKGDFKNTTKRNPRFTDTLASGIRVSRIWENKQTDSALVGVVRIDSSRKTGSGSYRLKILEKGNFKNPRIRKRWGGKLLRKPVNTGDIKGSYFFKRATESNESSFYSNMRSEINKAIDKINNG